MFVIPKPQPSKASEGIIRKTLTMLWDIGYKVGHSTRSIAQTIKQANGDMITKTSLLESRYLSGDRDLLASSGNISKTNACAAAKANTFPGALLTKPRHAKNTGGASLCRSPTSRMVWEAARLSQPATDQLFQRAHQHDCQTR